MAVTLGALGRNESAQKGEPVDTVTVAEELRRASQLDNLGGRQTLLRIQASTPASANATYYAQIVGEHIPNLAREASVAAAPNQSASVMRRFSRARGA